MMRRAVILLAKLIVSGSLIYWAVHKLDLTELIGVLMGTDPAWIVTALMLLTVSYALGALQWRLILRLSQIDLTYGRVLAYYYVGLFFNNFLISGMGGDLLRVYDIQKHAPDKERLSPALASVLFDRFAGLLTLVFLACLSGAFVIGQGESMRLFASIAGLFLLWLLILAILLNKQLADRTIKPLASILPSSVYTRLQHLYYEMHQFRNQPDRLAGIFGTSIVIQTLRVLSIWAVGRALGDGSSLTYYLVFVPVISLAASLPVSIGGTGPREQTSVFLFRRIGVAQEVAFSIGFVTYLVGTLSALPGAAAFLLRKKA